MGNSATKEARPPPRTYAAPEERPRRREGERRETKVERDARRLERERQARLRERELSLKDESVDGGFLVTLGVYTGIEDFNKQVVRQLIIERRLAPFFKGLNDHDPGWTDEEFESNVKLAVSQSIPETTTPEQEPPAPVLSTSTPTPHTFPAEVPVPFRPRAKTMSMAVLSRPGPEMTPQEQRLPDELISGRPIEAVLYKDAIDCPICFLAYPPYLNKTRCCDQPICSECFVQIKRPDPHPPEHEGSPERPADSTSSVSLSTTNSTPANPAPTGEFQLVSEPAACPFCKQPEFGVTYEPPPFRRGIIYAGQSPLSSSPATPVYGHSRRRTTSLSANAPTVITTDRIRPDWSQKLATARAHAARRAAAATALHTAAYMMNGTESRSPFRRRREGFGIAPRQDRRVVDLEEMMMMEAIRLSIVDEEERRRKADSEWPRAKGKDVAREPQAESSTQASAPGLHLRQLSASSSASSIERLENSSNDSLPSPEPMFNFSSLAAMIDADAGDGGAKEDDSAKPHV